MWDGHLRRTNIAEHGIELSPADAKRNYAALHRVRPIACEFERNEIEKMLSKEIIEPVQSAWAESIVFARKRMIPSTFASNVGNETLLRSGNLSQTAHARKSPFACRTAVFSTKIASSGYWPVEIVTKIRDKATITSHHRLYCFLRMPFGLSKVPLTFH